MNKLKFVLFLLILSSLSYSASAQGLEIAFNFNDNYTVGDILNISYTITNRDSFAKNLTIESSLFSQQVAPYPLVKFASIGAGQNATFNDLDYEIYDGFGNGLYGFGVQVYSDNLTILGEDQALFYVYGSSLRFDNFSIKACKDIFCKTVQFSYEQIDSPLFIKASDYENAGLIGYVQYPDGSNSSLIFMAGTAMLKVKQAGDYSVFVTASKKGYADSTAMVEFYVAEAYAQPNYLWLIILLLLLVIAIFIYLIFRARQKEKLRRKHELQHRNKTRRLRAGRTR